ncbi:MAG: phospholipase D-like domain-containing protein [Kofleriaceae bacterium]|nr:phospholipase D-like domain-containing protein [Kofleriaceae bacterium]
MWRSVLSSILLALPVAACGAQGTEAEDDDWRAEGKADEAAVPLRFESYDVLFTNPLCRDYTYATPVETADGTETLTQKPKNVWCSREDMAASAARPTSPQYKLLEWLEPLGGDDEIFLAYLSFSNVAVADRLCALAEAGAKVTFVLDAASTQSDRLAQCGAEILLRGHAGSIGYAHNKFILINPRGDSEHMKMTFSSGNMSSGVVTHHENWHFIDVARDSYFAQNHICLMDAQISEEASSGRTQFRNALNACREQIEAPEETDIKSFFIPHTDDRKRAQRYLLDPIEDAASIDLGAHRFGHTALVNKLTERLEAGELTVRMVADDDLYWLDPEAGDADEVGANLGFEAANVAKLEQAGGDNFEIRYFETNHNEHLLHHNKYLVYRKANGKPFGLIAGAANLTGSGFNDNFENIYFIKVPAVLKAFDTQFARVWDGKKATPDEQDPPVATPRGKMPATNITPR